MTLELAVAIWLIVGALAWVWAILWRREITISGLFAVAYGLDEAVEILTQWRVIRRVS